MIAHYLGRSVSCSAGVGESTSSRVERLRNFERVIGVDERPVELTRERADVVGDCQPRTSQPSDHPINHHGVAHTAPERIDVIRQRAHLRMQALGVRNDGRRLTPSWEVRHTWLSGRAGSRGPNFFIHGGTV